MVRLRETTADGIDPAVLADIRADAMRPSLEAIGRFDPQRARNRFLKTFDPLATTLIHAGENFVGFYVLRRHPDHFYLDHFYIRTEFQGQGTGRAALRSIQTVAQKAQLPIRLVALIGSPANQFYATNGFDLVPTEDEFDNHYLWEPAFTT
jgi:GNAT superfamily N-acetyltransferase